jgi:NhaP-type Na+/H+ or K+/H+ antiporter
MPKFLPYVILVLFIALISTPLRLLLLNYSHIVEEVDFQLFVFGTILFTGYLINRIAPKTIVPSFVWAIFAGIALQPILDFYIHDLEGLKVVIEVLAALVLFAGGLEITFKSFKNWFGPITSLSLLGVVLSSVTFALALYTMLSLLGLYSNSLLPSILILSAALASTDPTAIIPTLKTMKFKRGFLKQIAISESALTDVSGSVITKFLLLALITVPVSQSNTISTYLGPLLQKASYDALALQIMSGLLVGSLGFWLLKKFYRDIKHENSGYEIADPALLISVPIFTYVLGNLLGGAGFLASFVAGLLTELIGQMKKAEHFYNSFLDHLIKPFIFITLGALVPLDIFIMFAPLGIFSGLLFIFVIRPFVVFMTLWPWLLNHTFQVKDLLFLSLVRETGIISAVLLVIASTFDVIQSDFVIAMGMWVILLTLVIEPPLTPYLSKKIGVAK